MDEIGPEDIREVANQEPTWLHVHPDYVDTTLDIFGWTRDDVIIEQEFPASYAVGRFYISIRKKG